MTMTLTIRSVLLGLTILLVGQMPALADKRVALVIGNSAYQNVTRLDNPRNDAKLMAETLKSVGFDLVGGGAQLDLDKPHLDQAVQGFGDKLQGADVALFYYAGHGLQVRGSNYLVPINANPTKEADLDFQMLDASVVLRQMEGAGAKLNLVILDACRNNPFGGRGLRATEGGLAQMRAPEGTLISYATQPGNVAQDGADGNSPYTKALSQTIKRPGLDIFRTFNEVGLAVIKSTGSAQQPWTSTSPINGDFYFTPGAAQQNTATTLQSSSQNDAAQAWAAVQGTTSVAVLEDFARRYSDSIYGTIARAKLDDLKKSQVAVATPVPAKPEVLLKETPTPSSIDFPARPVRIIVPYAAGGSSDIVARIYAAKMSEKLGQPFIIENRAGAGGAIGAQAVARAPADGYQLLLGTTQTQSIYNSLTKSPAFDSLTDFAPVAVIGSSPAVVVVPSSQNGDLRALVANAKANPGKLTYASSGAGTFSNLAAELFKLKGGSLDILHVPYRGTAPAMTDLLAGRIDMLIDVPGFVLSAYSAGQVKILGVASSKRSSSFPNVPTIDEALGTSGIEASSWYVIEAPASTPPAIINKLNAATRAVMADSGLQTQLKGIGTEAVTDSTPASARALIAKDRTQYKAVADAAGIRID
ncbi:MAG: caspase family protein [Afipia sp.]|nr:caspase family protein [Afipia sp.]